MDKARDMRTGANRLSKQSENKLSSGFKLKKKKKKKEKIKKLLSVVGKHSSSYDNYEMNCCDVSDKEEEEEEEVEEHASTSCKSFKLPKRFLDDCCGNGVNHSSVPRKLRSAMKKRNRESVSPPLPVTKKLNKANKVSQSPKKDNTKKSKLNMKKRGTNCSYKQAISEPITKDEEEVVETLYALAGMFPDSNTNHREVNLPCLSQEMEGINSESVIVKEDLSCHIKIADTATLSNCQKLPEENSELDCSKLQRIKEACNLHHCGKRGADLEIVPFLSNNGDRKLLCNSNNLSLPRDQTEGTSNQKERFRLDQKSETTLGLATTFGIQMNAEQTRKEEANQFALWPGLCSSVPDRVQDHALPTGPPINVPAWLDANASSATQNSFQNHSSSGKESKTSKCKLSQTKSTAHVHICHVIQALKMPQDTGNKLLLKRNEELKKNEITKFAQTGSIINNATPLISSIDCLHKKSNEANNDSYQHGNVQRCSQGFDFLSLSAGNCSVEANESLSRAVNVSGKLLHQVPYIQSCLQNPMLVPFSAPQTRYSSVHPNLPSPSAATQQAPPQLQHPYLSNPVYGTTTSTTALMKQQQCLQHQQQRFWAAQLGSQYRPAVNYNSGPANPSSASSLGVAGPKYPQFFQHLVAMNSPLPSAGLKRQDHHAYSAYEDTGSTLHRNGALPLQLLCNNRSL